MANYYTDHPEIEFHLNHPLMKRIVELKERDYADKDNFDDAPVNYEDAIENYKRMLDITGDVAANIIEPNSESVDQEGPHLVDGRMVYASKTFENLDATRKAGLWGISMPRRYNGLNIPNVVFSMASEIISAADAGFQNVWSLQSCIGAGAERAGRRVGVAVLREEVDVGQRVARRQRRDQLPVGVLAAREEDGTRRR